MTISEVLELPPCSSSKEDHSLFTFNRDFKPLLIEILQGTMKVLYSGLIQTTPGLKSNLPPCSRE